MLGSLMMLLLILTIMLVTAVSSFSTHPSLFAPSVANADPIVRQNQRRRMSILLSSARDEEIAKLEEQLRQLREKETSASSEVDTEIARALDPDDARTLKEFADARRRLEKVRGKDMLLTEQELIKGGLMGANSNGNSMGAIPAIAVVIAAFVGLIVFSQIPIGQEDLARYSATGSSSLKSIDLGDLNPDVKN